MARKRRPAKSQKFLEVDGLRIPVVPAPVALDFLRKPEGRFILGFGRLLGDFLEAKANEILPTLKGPPLSQKEARERLAEIQKRLERKDGKIDKPREI